MYIRLEANRKFEPGLASLVAVILILFSLFMIRFIDIALKKKVKGNLAYVQLLNSGMPILKGTYYDEQSYVESKVNVWSITLEAANLSGFNPISIINYEIPFLKDDSTIIQFDSSAVRFDPFELNDVSITKADIKQVEKPTGPVQANVAYNPNLKKTLNQAKPEVLIYHTHTTEAYLPEKQDSSNNDANVVAVGTALEKELEQNYGISVIHDTTMHSAQYDESYDRSGQTVETYLKKYGDFKLIIDLHRDAMGNGNKNNFVLSINNENVAKIMFVTAKNNPHYEDNLKMVNSLDTKAKELFPGFCKGIHSYNRGKCAFNQTLSKNSVLIEVGAEGNTADEAKGSAKYIGRLIAENLNKKKT